MEESFANVCRTCLTEQQKIKSIFRSEESSGTNLHIAEMIMAYTSLQITLGDGLPEGICEACAEKAVKLYHFKIKCEESDSTLREKLGRSLANSYSAIEEKTTLELGIDPNSIDIIIKPEYSIESDDDTHESASDYKFIGNKIDENCETYILQSEQERTLPDDSTNNDKSKQIESNNSSELPNVSCDICCKEFSNSSLLNRHRKSHFKNFTCTVCSRAFSRNDLLIKHQQSMHPSENNVIEEIKINEIIKDLTCMICNEAFLKKEDYNTHVLTHTERKDDNFVECHICHKRLTKTTHLTRHLRIHSAVKPHVCQLCGKGFARAEQLNNHKNVHSGIKPHICNICNKGFNQVSNLKDHMRTHNGEKPFLCSICGKGFNQLGNLRQHTIRHSGIKAHLCSICGNGFASKGELCAHLRKHTGARPFVCPICKHGFTTSSSLTKHKRIHSGEKPYECDVCKMRFSRSGILARHKRTHTGEKPYVCKYCSKAFTQSNDLASHLRIHTGEKPYICDVCGQAFRQSSALKTHKKVHIDKTFLSDWSKNPSILPQAATLKF